MTLAYTRARLNELWEEWELRGEELMEPYYSHLELEHVWKAVSGERRLWMEQVLCEWLGSEESSQRSSACTLLCEARVAASVEPLKELGERLAISDTPWDRDERRMVLAAATEIEAADGYDRLVADEARTARAASDAQDLLDAERKAFYERNPVKASESQLEYAAEVLWAWQQERDTSQLAALAEMISEHWAPDAAVTQLLLAICRSAQSSG